MNVKRFLRVQSLVVFLLLAGCASGSVVPTSTQASTPIPIPVTPTPASLSPETVNAIVPLRRYGMGIPTDVAYAPDGGMIAVPSSIGIYRYLTKTYEELPLIETGAYVRSIAFSPDSRLIAAGEENGGLRLWEARDGTLVRALEGHIGKVASLAFSPDGQLLASAAYNTDEESESASSIVKVWRVTDGALLAQAVQFSTSPAIVSALAFSPQGDLLISAAGMIFMMDGTGEHLVRMLEAYNGNTDVLKEHQAALTGLAFSPDGEMLAVADQDHTVQFWQTSDWTWVDQTLTVPEERQVDELVYSSDGRLLIGSGYPIRFWDAETRLLLDSPSISGEIALSPDGESLAVLGDYQLELWRLSDFSRLHTWEGYTDEVDSLDVSPDGQVLAAGTFDGPARLLKVKDGSLLRTLPDAQMDLHFSPDGQTLLAVQYGVQFWQSRDGTLQDTYEWGSGTAESAAYSPDGRLLAVGLERDGVEVMSASRRNVLLNIKWETEFYNPIATIAFSPDSRLLATGDREPTVRLWDAKDGKLVWALEGHTLPVYDVAFSPDGTILASASQDKMVRLWRVEDGSLLQILEHPRHVLDVTFSPNGQLLASACADNTVKLWDMDGNLLATLSAHTDTVGSLVFLPDGMTLASGSIDGTIWLWGLAFASE
jgi:WD40 repeat protein